MVGIVLVALAPILMNIFGYTTSETFIELLVKVFPDPTVRSHIYRDYLIFLGVSIVVAFVYNAISHRNLTSQFRPVPLREVYEDVDVVAERT